MKRVFVSLIFSLVVSSLMAQFTVPSVGGQTKTLVEVHQARPGTYVTVTGYIVAHLGENYYTFRDATGKARIEIENEIWQGRRVSPETKVTLFVEIDQDLAGRYLWVESLQIVE